MTDILVRPARVEDLEALHMLASSAGLGMTNLPACRSKLGALLAGSDEILADPDRKSVV